MAIHLFSQVSSDRMSGNSLKLHQRRIRLDFKKNFFMEIIVNHWNRLPGKVAKSPSLKVWFLETWFSGRLGNAR